MSHDSDNPYAAPNFATRPRMPASAVEDELADRGTRLIACLLDVGFLCVLLFPVIFLIAFAKPSLIEEPGILGELLLSLVFEVIFLGLNGYLLATNGQTIGKYIMKIQVVDQKTGELLPFVRVYVYRYLWLQIISFLLTISSLPEGMAEQIHGLISLVDVLFIFGAAKLCIHDHFAHSKVVRFQPGRPRLS